MRNRLIETAPPELDPNIYPYRPVAGRIAAIAVLLSLGIFLYFAVQAWVWVFRVLPILNQHNS